MSTDPRPAMPADKIPPASQTTETNSGDRPTKQAMLRAAAGRCPNCGEGKIFSSYLKVNDHCPNCGEALHHQRADDGPAYLTILIVSHIAAPMLLWIFIAWRPSTVSLLLGFGIGTIVASLLLLPRIKGAMIGLQWARRMHGFGIDAQPETA